MSDRVQELEREVAALRKDQAKRERRVAEMYGTINGLREEVARLEEKLRAALEKGCMK